MILPKVLGYYFQKPGQLAVPKNWTNFVLDLSKKFEGTQFSDLSGKKLDLRIFVGRIQPRSIFENLIFL